MGEERLFEVPRWFGEELSWSGRAFFVLEIVVASR
jgi:hypothetical protein